VDIPYAINDGFVRKDGVALGQYKRQDDGKGSHKPETWPEQSIQARF